MKDENIYIGKLLQIFFSYWKIYVPIGAVCFIGAILFILITPKEYEFTSRMQLIRAQQSMISELKMLKSSAIGSLLGVGTSESSVEDEMIIVLSRSNMSEAIRSTNYQIQTRSWQGMKNALLYGDENPITFCFPEGCLDTLSQLVKFHLKINGNQIDKIKVKSKLFKTITVEKQHLPCTLNLPVGVVKLLPNKSYKGESTMSMTTRILPMQKVYEDLVKRELFVGAEEPISDIIRLNIDDEHKLRGCNLLNTIMESYNCYSKRIRIKEANLNAQFIKERLDSVTYELSLLEHQLESYKQTNNFSAPMLYAEAALSGKQELESNVLEMEVRLKMLDYVINYIQSPEKLYASIPVVEGIGEKSIMHYNQLLLDRQRLLLTSQDNNPTLILIEQQLKEQRRMLFDAINASRKSIQASLDEVQLKNKRIHLELLNLPTKEREYIELKRQQKIKESIYLFLMQKLQEKELSNAPDECAARIIDTAYFSSKPVFPKKSIVLVVALIIACVISFSVISFLVFNEGKK